MSAEPERPPRPADRPGFTRAVGVIGIVGLFAYYNSLHGAFVLDDARLLGDPNIGRPWASSLVARPVVAVSFSVNYWLDGLNPRGYHAFNLLFHVVAGVALYDLVRRTLHLPRFAGRYDRTAGWLGLVVAAVWLAHPLQTQAVTYIVQRCESLMGMFFLLGFWSFVRGATADRGRWWWYAGAAAACALGTGCKEMMLALPMLVVLYDRTFLAGSWRAGFRVRWPVYLLLTVPPVVGVAGLVVTGFLTDGGGTVGFGVKNFTPWTYLLTQTEVILHYLRLTFWPTGQALDYIDWPVRRSLADCWPAAVAVSGLLAVTAVGVALRTAWGFLGAWFFVILAPTSSFIPLQDAAFEHRMYLSLAAVVALLVGAIAAVVSRAGRSVEGVARPALAVAAGVVVVALAFLSVMRNEEYSSTARLYRADIAVRPENPRVRLNLANVLLRAGQVEAADRQVAIAERSPIRMPMLRVQRTTVLREMGRTAEAVRVAEDLVASDPESPRYAYELGMSLLADGRPGEAVAPMRQFVAENPGNYQARFHYGLALDRSGQGGPAAEEFRAVTEESPEYAGQLLRSARRTALDPDALPSHLRMAAWYAEAGCRMKSRPEGRDVDTLAICLTRVGEFDRAAAEADRAAALARADGDEYLASRIAARADLFRKRQPYLPASKSP